MCKNVAAKGKYQPPISIYDVDSRRAESVHATTGHCTRIASSISDAVKYADILFFSVPDDAIVRDVVNEITSNDIHGKTVVDCSTIHPDTTAEEEQIITSRGAHFVACPVFGAAAMADSGELICNLAGNAAATEKVRPYCDGVMSAHTIDLSGMEPSKATLMKIVGNTFVLNMVSVLAEGHVLAEKSGLGTDTLHAFMELMFPGPYTKYSQRMISGDYYQREVPLFSVGLARKDARHAQSIAKGAGVTLKNVEVADSMLQIIQQERGGTAEMAAMYGAKRLEAGLNFENQSEITK
jgi:3-hydroxyisobutyrate dehydrogenase-like beta-hydroxyacid dehydrogenase